jgi:hypothetical protein
VTTELQHSCAPNRGTCMTGLPDYCTTRCETTPCPSGYTCTTITLNVGGPPSGQYCVRNP